MVKSRKIGRIVRLREILRRWSIRPKGSLSSTPPAIKVPAGHVAVYVGSRRRRFVLRVTHLNHPSFRNLLRQAEEEFGFSQPGPLCLPCNEFVFLQILCEISSTHAFQFNTADNFHYPESGSRYCSRARNKMSWRPDAGLPLLRGFDEE